MNSIETFNEITLPPKEKFYFQLNDCGILDQDYEHAQKVWKEFKMKTMGDYHDLISRQTFSCLQMYLKSSEVFVLRSICLENYSLEEWQSMM